MITLSQQVAIVTGAANGIGRACAMALAQHGADVVLIDRDAAGNQRAAQQIAAQTGRQTLALEADISDDSAPADCLAATLERFARCDILINNAGIIRSGGLLELSDQDFDAVLGVNLRACFRLSRCVARHMVDQGVRGSIINMSSVNAELAIGNQLAYVSAKGGLRQLTKACALELAPHGIRVNAIGPGSIMTEVLKTVMTDDAARRKILSRTPLGRIGEPDEIARIAVFLASDYASYITGQTLYADGGRMALNYTVAVADE